MRSSGRSAASSYRSLAPEELPLYPSLLSQFQGAKRGRGGRSSDDQLLGFGAAEALTMLTPVILSFTSSFWQALVAEAAQGSAHGVLDVRQGTSPGAPRGRAAAAHGRPAPARPDGGRA